MHGVGRIGVPLVDCALVLGALQHRCTIAAHNPSAKLAFLQRASKRPADQAISDDGDLSNGHSGNCQLPIANCRRKFLIAWLKMFFMIYSNWKLAICN